MSGPSCSLTWWELTATVAGAIGIAVAVGLSTQGRGRRPDQQLARHLLGLP
jgi:hypothetical protein